ncbi:MAG: hypothetical protein ACE5HI_12290 [bacterium]
MRVFYVLTILYAITMLACSTTKGTYTKKNHSSRDYISAEEIRNSSATNVYDLIRSLRPNWLRGRGAKSISNKEASYPVVYVNESKHGDINSLSSISVENITAIQFLNSSDATNRFGLDHASGAILITIF